MPKQVLKICFCVFFFLSLNQISYSKSTGSQTVSEDLESNNIQSSNLSPESNPEDVREPDFFSPEHYPVSSPPPVAEILETDQLQTDYYNVSVNKAVSAQSPSTDFPLPETKTVSSEPEADAYKAQVVKLATPEPAPSKEAAINNSPIKKSVPAPSIIAIPLSEAETESTQVEIGVNGVSPAPNSSILTSKTEDADTLSLESDQNNDYNSTIKNPEDSLTLQEDGKIPEQPTTTTFDQESTSSPEEDTTKYTPVVVDEDVDIPPISSNNIPYTYRAEDETVDIVYEEYGGGWGSWAGQQTDGATVAGVMVGVCLVCLVGLVYNAKKKKKTQFQYQTLSKGI